ncbi:hypothetical protein FRC07_008510 [Ceratobasidium sp. 392]|nr:hypothetical protein FRC07_008510 [Ceratobasidium sp. 392]
MRKSLGTTALTQKLAEKIYSGLSSVVSSRIIISLYEFGDEESRKGSSRDTNVSNAAQYEVPLATFPGGRSPITSSTPYVSKLA